MQPNSYAHQMNHIPHDPDEKDRELADDEEMLPNSEDLTVGIIAWFPEKKLRLLLSDDRYAKLGPDVSPWVGWAEIKKAEVFLNADHAGQSIVHLVTRFLHSGQALSVPVRLSTPWVIKK